MSPSWIYSWNFNKEAQSHLMSIYFFNNNFILLGWRGWGTKYSGLHKVVIAGEALLGRSASASQLLRFISPEYKVSLFISIFQMQDKETQLIIYCNSWCKILIQTLEIYTLMIIKNNKLYFSLPSVFTLDWMFQHCIVLKVLFGKRLCTHRTLGSAAASVNVLHDGVMIIVMAANFTLHGLNHLLQC